MSLSTTTRDHEEIRRWAEERGAIPSEVASTHKKNEPGILRFQFPGTPRENDKNLREISWDAFFEKFDENNLELLYQEKTAEGEQSNFNKLVNSDESSSGNSSSGTSRKSSSGASSKASSTKAKSTAADESADEDEDLDEDEDDDDSQDSDEE